MLKLLVKRCCDCKNFLLNFLILKFELQLLNALRRLIDATLHLLSNNIFKSGNILQSFKSLFFILISLIQLQNVLKRSIKALLNILIIFLIKIFETSNMLQSFTS